MNDEQLEQRRESGVGVERKGGTGMSITGRSWSGAAVLAVLAGVDWWVWLGTDTTYQRDPVSGIASGPYEVRQVVACAAVLVVLAVASRRWSSNGVAVTSIAVGFTVPWSVHAAARDSTGLFGVGSVMLLVGIVLGGLALLSLLDGAGELWRSRRQCPSA